jgi:N-acetylglutamate synthase-like GNAT family acetyltransferase
MTFGSEIEIRQATAGDIDEIKKLFDQHKTELGFVVKSALLNSIRRSELIVALAPNGELVGIVHYRHRKDGQTTLYSIVVVLPFRRQSIATSLVGALRQEALVRGQRFILLKCPTELAANEFYRSMAFHLVATENGKHRRLHIWQLDLGS